MSALDRLLQGLRSALRGPRSQPAPRPKPGTQSTKPGTQRAQDGGGGRTAYPGDATTLPDTTYSPAPDGNPDPGEIVWTWVPYEEDHTQGKDRPVLVIGREADWLVALPLTSKDHDVDEQQERRSGREWVDIGTGDWDRRGRPSEVRVNRLVRVDPHGVRREGAVLPRDRYERVVAAARAQLR
ncbi:PemK-like, MazF-like toxin of type II toxin-antitoxin system [Humibacillus xanthopallidus]|uniref:PemK-like, MazF-like toxin of type II toxin-antitoxin system n=1 Tax=Humibacillus xanthopallidus TaxID=412689 RepID=A0A543PTF3_9MICO|nr:type II toxin-antitoxin system PemK/MazF family toxin [Humibacillus xanthopallidus]TQN47344.1 PemK-like, MazF-like toxin of type II toxin-antitoxin system [Humibacillus xanthopallidus]